MSERLSSTIVAVALIAMIGACAVAAIMKYSVDDALKIWAGIGTLFGALLGSLGTYFFTRQTITQAEARAHAAEASIQSLRK